MLDFAERTNNYLFNSKIGVYLFPDLDVKTVKNNLRQKGNNRTASEQTLHNKFERFSTIIKYLPITPELGLWNWIISETQNIQSKLDIQYSDSTFNFSDLIQQTNNHFVNPAENPRQEAKNKFKYLISLIESRTNEDSKRIGQFLFGTFVRHYYSDQQNKNIIRQTFGQIFNRRGNILQN